MWGDYYDSDDRDRDRDYEFEITCPSCGATRLNTDPDYCSCGSSGGSYASHDAGCWNDHLRRTGR